MKFDLIDSVLEQSDKHIVVIKQVSLAEEYLADHFPTFPVLPGVLMVELMVQAARRMLAPRGDARLVLGEIKAVKFARLVRPGEALAMEVRLGQALDEGAYQCRATGTVRRHGQGTDAAETAVSGRFIMRPIRRPASRADRA